MRLDPARNRKGFRPHHNLYGEEYPSKKRLLVVANGESHGHASEEDALVAARRNRDADRAKKLEAAMLQYSRDAMKWAKKTFPVPGIDADGKYTQTSVRWSEHE